jgi:hypothetical protein
MVSKLTKSELEKKTTQELKRILNDLEEKNENVDLGDKKQRKTKKGLVMLVREAYKLFPTKKARKKRTPSPSSSRSRSRSPTPKRKPSKKTARKKTPSSSRSPSPSPARKKTAASRKKQITEKARKLAKDLECGIKKTPCLKSKEYSG